MEIELSASNSDCSMYDMDVSHESSYMMRTKLYESTEPNVNEFKAASRLQYHYIVVNIQSSSYFDPGGFEVGKSTKGFSMCSNVLLKYR